MPTAPANLTTDQLWSLTHTARAAFVDDLEQLTEDQWRTTSLCGEWDVEHVVAHLSAAASTGTWRWVRSIVASGFRPAVHNARRLGEQLGASPAETLSRFRALVDSTVAPSKDLAAYLGEVLVHAQDVRVPLGLADATPVEAWLSVAEFYVARDFAVNSHSVAKGLRLEATDSAFTAGQGPLVSGATGDLVMAMAGRPAFLDRLTGVGVATLRDRLA